MHDSRGIEIVNFTISLALSAGTLMASAGSPYRLVPAHFYPWLYITPHMPSYIPTKWRTYRDHRFCDVISPHVYHRRSTASLSQWSSSSVYSAIPSREFIRPTWYLSYVATVTAGYRAERFATCCHLAYASHWAYLLSTAGHVYYVSLQNFLFPREIHDPIYTVSQ